MRDGEGAARSHTSRGCAAHAVHSRRPSGERTGNAASLKVLLPDADKLWDSLSERSTDALLDDDVLVDRVAEALAERHPQSRRRGRLGTPAVLTRSLRRIGEQVRERTRSVVRRVFEIAQRSRTTGSRARPGCEQSQAKMKVLYQGLMRITRTVVRHAVADGGLRFPDE